MHVPATATSFRPRRSGSSVASAWRVMPEPGAQGSSSASSTSERNSRRNSTQMTAAVAATAGVVWVLYRREFRSEVLLALDAP